MTTTRNEVTAMFNRFAGQSATLVIPRPYIDLCEGDHLAALLLSQILYWSDRTSDPDGWFAKSYADWHDEVALTERQIKRIVSGDDRRKQKGFSLDTVGVKTKLARSDYYQGAATLHYRVDYDVLSAKIIAFSQVPTNAGNDQCGKPPNGQNDDPTNGQNDHIHRLRSKTINPTGAKTAPDAGQFPEGTIGFDEMLDRLDLTQADIDAAPMDEIIPDVTVPTRSVVPLEDMDSGTTITMPDTSEIDPVGEYYRDMATVDDPPKPKRKRSEKQLALDGMKNALADAFGLAHDKVTGTKWNEFGKAGKELLEVGATPEDVKPLYNYCQEQDWPNFTSMAMAKHYAEFDKVRWRTAQLIKASEPPSDEACDASLRSMGIIK